MDYVGSRSRRLRKSPPTPLSADHQRGGQSSPYDCRQIGTAEAAADESCGSILAAAATTSSGGRPRVAAPAGASSSSGASSNTTAAGGAGKMPPMGPPMSAPEAGVRVAPAVSDSIRECPSPAKHKMLHSHSPRKITAASSSATATTASTLSPHKVLRLNFQDQDVPQAGDTMAKVEDMLEKSGRDGAAEAENKIKEGILGKPAHEQVEQDSKSKPVTTKKRRNLVEALKKHSGDHQENVEKRRRTTSENYYTSWYQIEAHTGSTTSSGGGSRGGMAGAAASSSAGEPERGQHSERDERIGERRRGHDEGRERDLRRSHPAFASSSASSSGWTGRRADRAQESSTRYSSCQTHRDDRRSSRGWAWRPSDKDYHYRDDHVQHRDGSRKSYRSNYRDDYANAYTDYYYKEQEQWPQGGSRASAGNKSKRGDVERESNRNSYRPSSTSYYDHYDRPVVPSGARHRAAYASAAPVPDAARGRDRRSGDTWDHYDFYSSATSSSSSGGHLKRPPHDAWRCTSTRGDRGTGSSDETANQDVNVADLLAFAAGTASSLGDQAERGGYLHSSSTVEEGTSKIRELSQHDAPSISAQELLRDDHDGEGDAKANARKKGGELGDTSVTDDMAYTSLEDYFAAFVAPLFNGGGSSSTPAANATSGEAAAMKEGAKSTLGEESPAEAIMAVEVDASRSGPSDADRNYVEDAGRSQPPRSAVQVVKSRTTPTRTRRTSSFVPPERNGGQGQGHALSHVHSSQNKFLPPLSKRERLLKQQRENPPPLHTVNTSEGLIQQMNHSRRRSEGTGDTRERVCNAMDRLVMNHRYAALRSGKLIGYCQFVTCFQHPEVYEEQFFHETERTLPSYIVDQQRMESMNVVPVGALVDVGKKKGEGEEVAKANDSVVRNASEDAENVKVGKEKENKAPGAAPRPSPRASVGASSGRSQIPRKLQILTREEWLGQKKLVEAMNKDMFQKAVLEGTTATSGGIVVGAGGTATGFGTATATTAGGAVPLPFATHPPLYPKNSCAGVPSPSSSAASAAAAVVGFGAGAVASRAHEIIEKTAATGANRRCWPAAAAAPGMSAANTTTVGGTAAATSTSSGAPFSSPSLPANVKSNQRNQNLWKMIFGPPKTQAPPQEVARTRITSDEAQDDPMTGRDIEQDDPSNPSREQAVNCEVEENPVVAITTRPPADPGPAKKEAASSSSAGERDDGTTASNCSGPVEVAPEVRKQHTDEDQRPASSSAAAKSSTADPGAVEEAATPAAPTEAPAAYANNHPRGPSPPGAPTTAQPPPVAMKSTPTSNTNPQRSAILKPLRTYLVHFWVADKGHYEVTEKTREKWRQVKSMVEKLVNGGRRLRLFDFAEQEEEDAVAMEARALYHGAIKLLQTRTEEPVDRSLEAAAKRLLLG